MIRFDAAAPFPLLAEGAASQHEEQSHSQVVDSWLGLRTEHVERALLAHGCRSRAPSSLREKQELWIGLATGDLLTPYTEIRRVLSALSITNATHIVDLGAAYGRMGFVVGRHFPHARFTGYEYVGERVAEGRRCLAMQGCTRSRLEHVDLSEMSFSPVEADIYFIYDYGSNKAIEKTLHDLRRIAERRAITVVARGRRCLLSIERSHLWLEPSFPNEPARRATIFRRVEACRDLQFAAGCQR